MFEIPNGLISILPRLYARTLFLHDRTSYDHHTYDERNMLVYEDRLSRLHRLYRLSIIVTIVLSRYEHLKGRLVCYRRLQKRSGKHN